MTGNPAQHLQRLMQALQPFADGIPDVKGNASVGNPLVITVDFAIKNSEAANSLEVLNQVSAAVLALGWTHARGPQTKNGRIHLSLNEPR